MITGALYVQGQYTGLTGNHTASKELVGNQSTVVSFVNAIF